MTKINAKSAAVTVANDVPSTNVAGELEVGSEVRTSAGGQDADAAAPDEAFGAASGEASGDNEAGTVGESLPKSHSSRQQRKKPETATTAAPRGSKTEAALKLLRRKTGASLAELQEATGWQAHSVRGFLSGTVRKKLALPLSSEVTKQGVRRYRIGTDAKAG
jgi:hypothetical protein